MAIQFENFQPNQGQRASANINRGLGEGINGLLSNKLNSMLKQQKHAETSNALKHLGFKNHESLAALPDELLKPFITESTKAQYRGKSSGKIKTVIPDLTDEQGAEIDKFEPGIKQELYRHYREDPTGFIDYINKNMSPKQQRQDVPIKESQEEAEIAGQENPLDQMLGSQEGFNPKDLESMLAQGAEPSQQPKVVPVEKPIPKVSELLKQGYSRKDAEKYITDAYSSRKADKKAEEDYNKAQQKAIQDNEKAFYNGAKAQKVISKEALTLIDEMISDLEAGKVQGREIHNQVAEGLLKKYANTDTQYFRTPEERRFNANARRLQGLDATSLKGPVGAYRIKFLEEQKPSIENDPETNLNILRIARNKATESINTADAAEGLVSKNKGVIPEGLSLNSAKLAKELGQKTKKATTGKIAKIDGKYVEILDDRGNYREISEHEAKQLAKVK